MYDGDRQFVNFTLQNELVQGQFYNITLGYSGKLDNDLAGLYYSSYDELDAGSGQMEKRLECTAMVKVSLGQVIDGSDCCWVNLSMGHTVVGSCYN